MAGCDAGSLASVDRTREPWNLNIHYDRLLVRLTRPGQRVLDVGCGDGFLSARLADAGCHVVALDADEGVVLRARARWPKKPVDWTRGDLHTHSLQPGSFDVVVSNATLHHMPDTVAALRRLGDLTRPGGTVGVVGLAKAGPLDWPMSLLSAVGIAVATGVRRTWEHSAPIVWPPPHTYGEVNRMTADEWPGRSYRRLWLGRYLVTWEKPAP